MLPKNTQDVATTPQANDAMQRAAERSLKVMANHPGATKMVLLGVVVALAAAWGSLALSRKHTVQQGQAFTQAFALKDALPEDLRQERMAARAEAKAASEGHKDGDGKDDDGDDGDDARDDDGDDGDDFTDDAAATGLPAFANKQARDAAARAAFLELAQNATGALGTMAALEATALTPADAAAEAKAANLALLEKASANIDGQNALMPIAMMRVAQAHEDAGEVDSALAAYERIIAAQIHFLGDEARLHKARLLLGQGNLSGADEALEDVQNNFPDTHLADELRIGLAALKAAKEAHGPQGASLSHPAQASRG